LKAGDLLGTLTLLSTLLNALKDIRMSTTAASFNASIDTTVPRAPDLKAITSFAEFYPFYLTEHRDRTCRRLHALGHMHALGSRISRLIASFEAKGKT
jgi:hypothetical protein